MRLWLDMEQEWVFQNQQLIQRFRGDETWRGRGLWGAFDIGHASIEIRMSCICRGISFDISILLIILSIHAAIHYDLHHISSHLSTNHASFP